MNKMDHEQDPGLLLIEKDKRQMISMLNNLVRKKKKRKHTSILVDQARRSSVVAVDYLLQIYTI